jgi:hypothetical protein
MLRRCHPRGRVTCITRVTGRLIPKRDGETSRGSSLTAAATMKSAIDTMMNTSIKTVINTSIKTVMKSVIDVHIQVNDAHVHANDAVNGVHIQVNDARCHRDQRHRDQLTAGVNTIKARCNL